MFCKNFISKYNIIYYLCRPLFLLKSTPIVCAENDPYDLLSPHSPLSVSVGSFPLHLQNHLNLPLPCFLQNFLPKFLPNFLPNFLPIYETFYETFYEIFYRTFYQFLRNFYEGFSKHSIFFVRGFVSTQKNFLRVL